ncbi:hypothetical protein ASPACDRAFT_114819 [Aspergillus aculeatus ATCC 16872]|uniref:Xylanolytic transcriptional activator regulatory domain-containing protein n=1 Tax=Aspergillus aculeatus (strain ATCC 16872 / CBS 172.66 / WB 5094) TaxID=690307 RepID=A0A1L9X123_ASPA1|nr:uncharacterized protein ASPACDRAFT_114819 [Aspergillus aculeatus ATCC 16872]OJK02123.1 hypothetical protein ASPACDRAFT_114819 [Aspergillus aculeatus ATCC 16872]
MRDIEKRVESLEGRLQQSSRAKRPRLDSRSEDLEYLSGDEADSANTRTSHHESTSTASPTQPVSQVPVETGEGDKRSYALHNSKGAMRFFGASSYLSIVSPDGACSLESQTGDRSLRSIAHRSRSRWRLVDWYPPGLQPSTFLNQSGLQPLPSKPLVLELVGEYFDFINEATPLFDPTGFMRLLDRQFSWNPDPSPSWWGALNVVLAFAYRHRAEKAGDGGDGWPQCMGHIRNAMSATTELFMRTSDLLAVQTMVGLALFFQGTPNPQPLFIFTATAIRFAQSIGLHKSNSFGLSDLQVEERRRVFWLAFIMDADVCTRTGRPAAQDIRDFDTPLPASRPHVGLGIIEYQGERLPLFSILAQFALIQRRAYDLLFTKEALDKPVSERAHAARACLEEIDRWKDSIGHSLRPQRRFSFSPEQHHPFLPQIMRLHFACHCFYISVSRAYLVSRPQRTTSEQGDGFPSPSLSSDEFTAKSLEAARSAVDLLGQIDDNHFGQSFEWSIVYFPAAAVVALFSQIMLEADHPLAASDLLMITRTVGFLSKLASQEPDTYVDYVLSVCSGFERAAREAIERGGVHEVGSRSGREEGRSSAGRPPPEPQAEPQEPGALPGADSGIWSLDPSEAASSHAWRGGGGPVPSSSISLGQDLNPTTDDQLLFPPAPLFWNWQDMLAGVPPAYYWNSQDPNTGG